MGTLLQNIVRKISPVNSDGSFVTFDLFLLRDDILISPVTCTWIVFINVYLAVIFKTFYNLLKQFEYMLICGWYCLAIVEFFLFYNHAWFYVDFGFDRLPMYSDTLIALTFVSSFIKEKINGSSRLSCQLY